MTGSVAGAVLLLLIGVGFLGAAVFGWLHRGDDDARPGALSIAVDLLVGLVALVDAAMSVIDDPSRALWWAIGSLALAAAVALLVLHHRRRPITRR